MSKLFEYTVNSVQWSQYSDTAQWPPVENLNGYVASCVGGKEYPQSNGPLCIGHIVQSFESLLNVEVFNPNPGGFITDVTVQLGVPGFQ